MIYRNDVYTMLVYTKTTNHITDCYIQLFTVSSRDENLGERGSKTSILILLRDPWDTFSRILYFIDQLRNGGKKMNSFRHVAMATDFFLNREC